MIGLNWLCRLEGFFENVMDDIPILKASGDYDVFEFVTEPFYEDPTEPNFLPMLDPFDSILKSFAFVVVLTPV